MARKFSIGELQSLPSTRAEALATNCRFYFPNKPCPAAGHVCAWRVKGACCIECSSKRTIAAYYALKDKKPYIQLLYTAKTRANKRKMYYDLSEEWAVARWTGKCELSAFPFVYVKGNANVFSPSIDRINNNDGYRQSNCRFILKGLNSLKGAMPNENFLSLIKSVASRLPSEDYSI